MEEKDFAPVMEIPSPNRSSVKREMIMALEAPQLSLAPSPPKPTTFSDTLQTSTEASAEDVSIIREAGLEETNEEAAVELPKLENDKEFSSIDLSANLTRNFVGHFTGCVNETSPASTEAQTHVSCTEIQFAGAENQTAGMLHSKPLEASLSVETMSTSGLPELPQADKPDKAEAEEFDVLGVSLLDASEFGNAPRSKELNLLEPSNPDTRKETEGVQRQSLVEAGTEIQHLCLSQPPQDGDEAKNSGIIAKNETGNGEPTKLKEESAVEELNFVETSQGAAVSDEELMLPKESPCSGPVPDQEDEVKDSQHVAVVHSFLSQADGQVAQDIGFDDGMVTQRSVQQAQSMQEALGSECDLKPLAAPETAAINESIQADAQASDIISLGKVPDNLFFSSTAQSERHAEGKDFTPNDAPSLFHVDSAFSKNMVSSVEGETVLIVENLGAILQAPTKLEASLSGMTGVSKAVDDERLNNEMKSIIGIGKDLVGRKVRKKFGKRFFDGQVVQYEPDLNWYKVVYEDGDEEELDIMEVRKLLAEVADDQLPNMPLLQHPSGSIDSLNKNVGQAIQSRSQPVCDNATEGSRQLQGRAQPRNLKRRHVIDTSNDAKMDSTDSDGRLSLMSEESLEDDDEDVTIGGKRRSRKRPKAKLRGKKRKKADNKPGGEKEFTPKLASRLKEEKSQETSTKHRIATRRSTGALHTHANSSSDHFLSANKKVHTDLQEKMRPEAQFPAGVRAKLIGRKTKKDFGGQFYHGEIIHYDNRVKYYKVRYEDGDEEELEWSELAPTLLPQEKHRSLPKAETPQEAADKISQPRSKEHPKKALIVKGKEGAIVPHDGVANNGNSTNLTRKWRKKVRTASVSVMMKGTDNWNAASTSTATNSEPPRPLAAVRFASASDADVFEFFGWGEAVNFDRSKCPELRATHLLPTSSPVVHLAASRHHLTALTAAGQVWVWRCKHGNVRVRCNEWEHVAALDNQNVILVDISGPDIDRASAGYEPEQEDQVPDPFYLAAVCSNGEDIILQGSQAHESVRTNQFSSELQLSGLREAVVQSNPDWLENMGRIVQVSVGMVEAADESPFVGYITDTDCVFIRSATRDFMEEVNLVTGFTGKPLKIQCGRVYHAIILTDDGRAWTWGQGYYPGSVHSAVFASKWSSPFSVCQPAVGTLVGRKVIDIGCYGEDFIALTNDGDVHQWTHALPNPAAGVYNVPATPVYGQQPSIGSGDKLKQVAIGAGICAGLSESGKIHTWRTSLKGGYAGVPGLLEREATTPLGREDSTDTTIAALGTRAATKLICVASSLIVVVKRKYRGRRGGKKKLETLAIKGKSPEDEGTAEGED